MGRILISITAFYLLASMIPAQAQMAVIDTAAIGKWSEQINAMTDQTEISTEQLSGINDISLSAKDTVDAIGKAGSITLPFANMVKLGSQLRRDAMCLLPNLEDLMPDLSFEDLSWNGICQSADLYRQSLFLDEDDGTADGDAPPQSSAEIRAARNAIQDRRQALYQDSVLKGLSGGDIGVKSSEELLDASDELESSAGGATTQNERLAVIARGQVLTVQALAQQNQILAQMLKLQAMVALESGLSLQQVTHALSEGEEAVEGGQ